MSGVEHVANVANVANASRTCLATSGQRERCGSRKRWGRRLFDVAQLCDWSIQRAGAATRVIACTRITVLSSLHTDVLLSLTVLIHIDNVF